MTQYKKHSGISEKWCELPWPGFQRETYCLQRRIYKASRTNGRATTINQQKLLLNSYIALAGKSINEKMKNGSLQQMVVNQLLRTSKVFFYLKMNLPQNRKPQVLKKVPMHLPQRKKNSAFCRVSTELKVFKKTKDFLEKRGITVS